jgi:hypothetical protein
MTRISKQLAALAVAGCLAVAAVGAPTASAKTTTLKFFQKPTSGQFLDANGQPISDPASLGPGASFTATDVDYVGNHKRHAKTWTASDHIACTFTSPSVATCDAQVAIGGSMLLANNVSVNFDLSQNAPIVVPINGGTGKYAHARGTATSVSVGNTNNSDFTVKFSG